MRKLLFILIFLYFSTTTIIGYSATNYSNDANCVVYFPMEDSGDETDESGNGSDLTETGGTIPQDSDKQVGTYSRDFESGDTEYLAQADSLSTDISGANQDLSIVFWVKHESDTGTYQTYVSKYSTASSNRQYKVYYDYDANGVNFILSDDGTSYSICQGATDVVGGSWYHVACVYNDTDQRIYINGSLDSNGSDNPKTYSSGIADKSAAFHLGEASGQAGYLDGLLDDVAVFDRELSSAEVSEIYQYGVDGSLDTGGGGQLIIINQ